MGRSIAVVVSALLAAFSMLTASATASPSPEYSSAEIERAAVAWAASARRTELVGEPAPTAPSYSIDLSGSDGGFRWSGTQTIELTNPRGKPLERVWLRLWGNRSGCRRQNVRIEAIQGAELGRYRVGCSAVELILDEPVAANARASVSFELELDVPKSPDRFGAANSRREIALLSNAIPALAHFQSGRWRFDRYFDGGETWTYPLADYRVRLSAPADVAVAAPGKLGDDGFRVLAKARDYAFAAGKLRSIGAVIAGVKVTIWDGARENRARLRAAERIVRKRLPRLIDAYGPYGWGDLQVVLNTAAAMEHTAFITTYRDDLTITHELAHMWWYASVSNDQAKEPWLDEALASYSEEAAGARRAEPACKSIAPSRQITRPVSAFARGGADYYVAVYLRGACMLERLRSVVGPRRFDRALRGYAISNRYGWSTTRSFRAAFDEASERSLRGFWHRYGLR